MADFNPMDAVCTITARQQADTSTFQGGNGVFLSPWHVLTAWHVIEGTKHPVFTNTSGLSALTRKGGRHIRKSEIDVAIAELDRPIGEHFASVSLHGSVEGLQTALYSRAPLPKPQIYPVSAIQENANTKDVDGAMRLASVFLSQAAVVSGQSGSPIFNQSTGQVVSILSGSMTTDDRVITVANLPAFREFIRGHFLR